MSKNNRVIKIGIVGLGIAGSSILPAIMKNPNVELVAATTLNKESLKKFAEDYKVEPFNSIDELCKSPNVDAVYIATPTELHTAHVLIAAENNKHIIVEKPFAITIKDADKMIDAAKLNGVELIVGHSHSFEPPIQKIREIVKKGTLGNLKMINNWYFSDWMYRPRTPDELNTTLGGGVTHRQGSHQIDIIRYIAGGKVRSVRAVTGEWDKERATIGSHSIFLEFENGVVATAIYNGYDHFHSTELTYEIGEGGPVAKSDVYANARKTLRNETRKSEVDLKDSAGYGGERAKKYDNVDREHPFFGLTIVSCEKGDIRQHPEGLLVYGEEEKYIVPIPKTITGRDNVMDELYKAVIGEKKPIHDGNWAKANIEVCIKAMQSSSEQREIILEHQVSLMD